VKSVDGQAILAIRRERGWTQVQLAARLGTDAVTVSRWERGKTRPRPSAVERLRRLLPPEGPSPGATFVEEPSRRLRKLDKARRDQLALKEAVRIE